MKKFLLLAFASAFLLSANAEQLNGIYTIDPAATATTINFKNVQSTLNYIVGNIRTEGGPNNTGLTGLSGAVTFNMSPGNYNEYVLVPVFGTSSTTNTITFQKLPVSTGDVIFNRSVSTSLTIFDMNYKSGKNLIFKNLVFQPTVTSTSGSLFYMVGNGTNLAFDDCKFDLRNIANRSISCIYNSDAVAITNCTFYNSFGTTLYQGSAVNSVTGLSMSNSFIQNTGFNATGVGIIENNSFTQSALGLYNNGNVVGAFRNNILTNATLGGSVT